MLGTGQNLFGTWVGTIDRGASSIFFSRKKGAEGCQGLLKHYLGRYYLIRRNFRADKFSRSFAFRAKPQFARNCAKISTEFLRFCAWKLIRKNIHETYPCFSFELPYIRFLKYQNLKVRENKNARKSYFRADSLRANARKFFRAKISTNKVTDGGILECIYYRKIMSAEILFDEVVETTLMYLDV